MTPESMPASSGCAAWTRLLRAALVAAACWSLTACLGPLVLSSPPSRLSPRWLSEPDLAAYFDTVGGLERQVVTDELGSYYHRSAANEVHGVFFSREDQQALKGLLSGDVGLLEPVYTPHSNGIIDLDWPATERRHRALTKDSRLRLAPLEATRRYAAAVQRFAAAHGGKLKGSFMAQMAAIKSGSSTLYNERFETDVLASLDEKFDYVVKDHLTGYYFDEQVQRAMGNDVMGGGMQAELLRQNIAYTAVIEFVPRAYFANIRSGAVMRVHSGCRLTRKAQALAFARSVRGGKEAQPDSLTQAVARLDIMRADNESRCASGFAELGIAGAIRSDRLQ